MNRIVFSDVTKKEMDLLGVEFPFTLEELKKAWKKKNMEFHPDKHNGDKAFEEKTKDINEAYSFLKNFAVEKNEKKEEPKKMKKRGLFELTETCPKCKGKGKTKVIHTVREKCNNCNGRGFIDIKCNKCNNGKFTLKNGRVVDCRVCKGTSIFKKIKCPVCNNLPDPFSRKWFMGLRGYPGYIFINKEEWLTCEQCRGEGVIDLNMWNPVVPKGAVLKNN